MPGTRAEGIFEELTIFEPWEHLSKSFGPQNDFLKSFDTPNTKPKIAQKAFIPLLQLYNSFHTPDIEQKNPNSLTVFLKLCLKIVFNNTKTILN